MKVFSQVSQVKHANS